MSSPSDGRRSDEVGLLRTPLAAGLPQGGDIGAGMARADGQPESGVEVSALPGRGTGKSTDVTDGAGQQADLESAAAPCSEPLASADSSVRRVDAVEPDAAQQSSGEDPELDATGAPDPDGVADSAGSGEESDHPAGELPDEVLLSTVRATYRAVGLAQAVQAVAVARLADARFGRACELAESMVGASAAEVAGIDWDGSAEVGFVVHTSKGATQ
ncbi:MAG: hypothetical protein ACK5MT_00540, partial [Actinomycetales bacterium]